jgi:hypothetical protein
MGRIVRGVRTDLTGAAADRLGTAMITPTMGSVVLRGSLSCLVDGLYWVLLA